MENISFFKKISLFFFYRKTLRSVRKELQTQFNARVDNVYRIYTVLNIPSQLIEEPYNVRKSDIDIISQNFVKEYSAALSGFMNKNGLFELYDFYDIRKVDKYSYLIIYGFSLFNTQKVVSSIFTKWIPTFGIISLILWFVYR